MARGSVNLFEQHVEKAAVGLAALFLLVMGFLYLVRSPNQVDYGGQKVTPNALAEAIKTDEETLRREMDKAKPVSAQVPDYSNQLTAQHSGGLFAAGPTGQPLVPAELPLAADFGLPIPKMSQEQDEGQADIVLVPPLAPAAPAVRTGRNLVLRERPTLSERAANEESAEQAGEPVELAWVSVASYFDTKTQADAMSKAGYATYLSKIYIAGLDLQRQELLPDGRFSEWEEVTRSVAMPQVDIPVPEIDAASGAVVNRDALNQAFATIKAHQQTICQAPFYKTQAGDPWKMPPLEGHADAEAQPKPKPKPEPKPEPGGKRGGSVIIGGAGAGGKATAAEEKEKRDQADKDLKSAEEAYRKSDDAQAQRYAKDVIQNEFARPAAKNKAKLIAHSVELLQSQSKTKGGGAHATSSPAPTGSDEEVSGKTEMAGVGHRSTRPPGGEATTAKQESKQDNLIKHPKDASKWAVWFHDDTVQSGKTYRYRMRVKLWNRYVTKFKSLKDPEQGKHSVVLGDWSLPSDPVTVPPAAYFFLTSAPPGKDTATVTVYKWHRGARVKQTFNVGIGDLIGGVQESETGVLDRQTLLPQRETVDYSTGAVVLDLRFDQPVVQRTISDKGKGEFALRDTPSAILVYLDPDDGQVKQRVERFDRYDPVLRQLREGEE
jgi:hypothetical protein